MLYFGRFRRAIVLMQISSKFEKRLVEMAEIFNRKTYTEPEAFEPM